MKQINKVLIGLELFFLAIHSSGALANPMLLLLIQQQQEQIAELQGLLAESRAAESLQGMLMFAQKNALDEKNREIAQARQLVALQQQEMLKQAERIVALEAAHTESKLQPIEELSEDDLKCWLKDLDRSQRRFLAGRASELPDS